MNNPPTATAQPETLSEALQKYRTASVAEFLGVTQQAVSAYKRGENFPGADRFERLAEFLGVDVAQIVRWATNRKAAA